MLMHSAALADPLNELTRELKKISQKRKKVDADHEEMPRIEFIGSLYYDEEMGVYIPGENIDSMLVGPAKKLRLGTAFKSAVFVTEDLPLIYDGPRTPDELWQDKRFRFRKAVKVQTNRLVRTRPQFLNWSLKVPITILDGAEIDADQVLEVAHIAGERIGLGDWRPRFGRFTVEQ